MEPIIKSQLDTDYYKISMGNHVFLHHPDIEVEYALTNRTKKVPLAEHVDVDELREQLDYARTIRMAEDELGYLANIRVSNDGQQFLFSQSYIGFLRQNRLPAYELSVRDGQFDLKFGKGDRWASAIYWETIALPIITELYTRALIKNMTRFEKDCLIAEGLLRLQKKIGILRKYPDITFIEFGTRRRYSGWWQDQVVQILVNEMPMQFLGTSNVYLAKKYGIPAIGTIAHEEDMVYAGLAGNDNDAVRNAHQRLLNDWWDLYGWDLSIALTDTFGSSFFFQNMTEEQARKWKGLRQDSGNPFEFGEQAIKFYMNYGIDPREKLIVFSDGLDVNAIIALADRFRGRIHFTFGWGTNLTNDLGLPTLSLVIKAVKANGNGLVKLSDNLAKAIGAPEDVERYKRIFGYENIFTQECRY